MKRTVRELTVRDIDSIINYFLQADHAFLKQMGVKPDKLPANDEWYQILLEEYEQPIEHKQLYYVIWEIDNTPVGHSNLNQIVFCQEAHMHLHLWKASRRGHGHGTYFIKESIDLYFAKFHLQNLFCEPFALNPAPNRTLPKAGFELVKTYETIPGRINFHQPVNRWVLTRQRWSLVSKGISD